jgi:hypothetical protein
MRPRRGIARYLYVGRHTLAKCVSLANYRLLGGKRGLYGRTRKGTLLESVPLGVTTWTFPLVAPAGTVAAIREGETTVKAAAVP